LEAKEQLGRMLRLQELAKQIAKARNLIEGAPMRMEEIEQRFRDRNTEYVALKDRYDELEADRSERDDELGDLEETKKKYTNDLMQVQNQREYAATLKEIDAVKSRISEHEDAILKGMEETETLKPEIEKFSAEIEVERTKVGEERAMVEAEVTKAGEEVERDHAERERIESELPRALVANLHRIEQMRQGMFLVKVEDGMCQACYVRVRPQVAQEIRLASHIHACTQCRRFLYHEPTLRPAAPTDPATSPDNNTPGAEAMDGGAV
jgi:predicted  nucleic acid-binding Zn-ribbon protein